VTHSLYFLTATWLAAQAGDARPMPQTGGPQIGGAPMVIQSGPIYTDGQIQGQTGNWQTQPQQAQQPRRGLLSRIGGWFGGMFGRNRQPQGTTIYQGNGQTINGPIYQGPVIQQPVNTTEPPIAGSGKVSMTAPQNGQVLVTDSSEMIGHQGETAVPQQTQTPISQVSHEPAKGPRMDLPLSEKFKNRIGHEADHSWLTGQLYRVKAGTNVLWVVRYATSEEQDKHGGTVVLAPAAGMQNFREGDLVSVQGQILNGGRASEQVACPVFRASEVSLVERGD
jgi:hypothetical protein